MLNFKEFVYPGETFHVRDRAHWQACEKKPLVPREGCFIAVILNYNRVLN